MIKQKKVVDIDFFNDIPLILIESRGIYFDNPERACLIEDFNIVSFICKNFNSIIALKMIENTKYSSYYEIEDMKAILISDKIVDSHCSKAITYNNYLSSDGVFYSDLLKFKK